MNGVLQPSVPPPLIEVRAVRIVVIVALVSATCIAGIVLMDRKVLTDNKTEIGMVLGWLVAKSGTVVDWLFGGSEGGSRRAEATPHPAAASPAPTGAPGDPVSVTEEPPSDTEPRA